MTNKITIYGLVQGIGFRPFVKRTAELFKLNGSVKNIGGIVEIYVNSDDKILGDFVQYLISHKPDGCEILKTVTEKVPFKSFDSFEITDSKNCDVVPVIPADIGVCQKCMEEFEDSKNPRYQHHFISCISCGPRYSIIKDLPYDRINTTMDILPLCEECKKEYSTTENRRCYAQTIACNNCGPKLQYTKPGAPLTNAINDIKNGNVVAIRDIGGYHFVCSATDFNATEKLRNLKKRDEKPFAVMFNNAECIKKYANISEKEYIALESDARPIVLLKKNVVNNLPENACKNSNDIGAFLPCNPVQYVLTKECGPLIMTSGNISGEPIITDNGKMLEIYKNSQYLEGVLYHDREIVTPLDDSIVRIIDNDIQLIRRGRGYTPLPVWLNKSTTSKIFASGGDLKASFCLMAENRAYLSQYFGDLQNKDNTEAYKANIERMCRLLNINPDEYVCDMHPAYFSAQYIKSAHNDAHTVQHHMAHIASVIAEHHIEGDDLGFAFDGTGYGTDGTVWGGEVFEYKNNEFTRKFHLKPIKLLGGDEISKNAKMVLDCYLWNDGIKTTDKLVNAALDADINTVYSSSMGRLFDAVSALLGICDYNTYEGKCATMLEIAASKANIYTQYNLPLIDDEWDVLSLISQIKNSDGDVCEKASGFHHALADAVLEACEKSNIKNIALSGGVFMNRLLTELCIDKLRKKGYNVYINRQVPSNDGGISLGQAYIISERMK